MTESETTLDPRPCDAYPSPEMTVNEVIRAWPGTVAVFGRHGMDSCCGGGRQVAEVAAAHGVPLDELLGELRDVVPG